ncbi:MULTISPECIES: dihydroorotase family protein [Haloferax]|uniref:Amidohydrolase family protein n=2 Tax=Haloferax TaxID=2251 RepID=A0A6G1Z713_9EURY|nr:MULTISPECIES: amidohydrolase family protein [Haloferax]KAB1185447.1 amidohydrolase family protein [Haloferax sp. CBA1149]MRW82094.1 amidohydrolase family protein [Haloferax marinisediminis]
MAIDTVINGGTVVTDSAMFEASVAMNDGKIVAVGDADSMPEADEVVDATGLLVMPGIIDPHVHIDDQFSVDSYETGTSAAALGGVTTYIDFAWQAWLGDLSPFDAEGTLLEGVRRKQKKGETALIDYSLHGAITREDPEVLDELADVVDAGVTSFKMFTAYEIGLGNGFMNRVLERIAELDAVGVFHTEDASICDELTALFQEEGKGDPTWYPQSRPDYAEAMSAEDAVRMAQEAGAKYYGIHTSNRKAADVLADFRGDGSMVRAETCTHYLVLDDSIYGELGNQAMIAPPIRKPDDNEAMFEHLRNGSLDVVSTDHCGYKLESKNVDNWWESTFGANGLQASLPVVHDEAVNHRGFSYPFLVRVMSTNPAKIFGLPNKGTLNPGADADVVLFDPNETYTITAADNASEADFSIYEGREVTGRVKQTFVRGELIAKDGEIVGTPGHGKFVERTLPDWDF